MELEAQLVNLSPRLNRLLSKLNKRKLQPNPQRPVHKRAPRLVQSAERRLGAAAVQQLIIDYEAGVPSADLMRKYDLGKGTVLSLLRRHGVSLRNQGLAEEDVATAARLYGDGWSLKRVGERFGCDGETVRKRLHAANVRIRKPYERP